MNVVPIFLFWNISLRAQALLNPVFYFSFFFLFLFAVRNSTFGGKDILGCSFRNCGLSDCWVPAIIPLPITKKAKQTEMTLYREKRDSGETAAVGAVIAVSAAAAMVAGLAMAQTSLVSDTVDKLARQVNDALQTQNALNVHIKFGLLNLNQQTALL